MIILNQIKFTLFLSFKLEFPLLYQLTKLKFNNNVKHHYYFPILP